jgi:hypothetical protein
MSNQNDISDVQSKNSAITANTVVSLPIRGEKRIVPSPVSTLELAVQMNTGFGAAGATPPAGILSTKGFGMDTTMLAELRKQVDYVFIRIQNRGMNASGTVSDPNVALVYRFLINPKTVNISHSTLDSQTLTRSGWQFGIWGEDTVKISMSGSTAGQYFLLGSTDEFAEYTESYRNLAQLQLVFENNGYWFEGEQIGEGPLAANATRRRIKMHNDVELVVGDFIWYGCFQVIQISQDADNPFLARFNLEFMAWKERFRSTSPYWNNIQSSIERGHSYSAYKSLVDATQAGTPPTILNQGPTANFPPFSALPIGLGGTLNTPPTPPALQGTGVLESENPPTQGMSPTVADFSVATPYVVGMDSSSGKEFWQVP